MVNISVCFKASVVMCVVHVSFGNAILAYDTLSVTHMIHAKNCHFFKMYLFKCVCGFFMFR